MRVQDVMTKELITVEPGTPIFQAQKLMREHQVRKLPVVMRGRLVGMVTHDLFMEITPSKATGFGVQEMHYLLNDMKVKEIMDKNPVTVSPDMPFEEALNLGQQKGNTGFPVMENGEIVGIITNGDIIRLLNKFLGLGEEGVRITIEGLGTRLGEVNMIISILDRHRAPILSLMTRSRREKQDLIALIRLRVKDATAIVEDLSNVGFDVTYVSKPHPKQAA
ncbi:MAG: CBS domain-containing protein [Deltaproteobacteria bacterium]